MKKVVFFDLDGTLLNTLPDIANSMNRALNKIGLKSHPVEAYKLFTGNGSKVLAEKALGGNTEHFDELYNLYREDYAQNSRIYTKPYNGIIEMLDELKKAGCILIVYTNKDNSDAQDVISYYFKDKYFDKIQGRVDGFPPKPDPALAKNILKTMGLEEGVELYYLGDTKTDMQCARNIGAVSIAVTWGFQDKDMLITENPNFFVDTPNEAVNIILKGANNA
ncbi:MAG: HAD family hydrolase [Eubacteriales bacterium]|nr:HAD family hydrolase [Eubacteriales bacterium]